MEMFPVAFVADVAVAGAMGEGATATLKWKFESACCPKWTVRESETPGFGFGFVIATFGGREKSTLNGTGKCFINPGIS